MTYHSRKKAENEATNALFIESDMALKFKSFYAKNGDYLNVVKDGDLVAEVGKSHLNILGRTLPKKQLSMSKWAWLLDESPERLLQPVRVDEYEINGELIAKISKGGGFFSWLVEGIKQKKFSPYDPFIRLEFDETKVDPMLALCLLLIHVSRVYFSPAN